MAKMVWVRKVLARKVGIAICIILLLAAGPLISVIKDQEEANAGKIENKKGFNQNQIDVSILTPESKIGFSSEIIELTDDADQNYFVNYRIKREQNRQETKEMLRLLLESDIRTTREEAQKRWLELSNKIAKEGEIENVLKMRGFEDVVSEVNFEKVIITVLTKELADHDLEQIKNITAGITGYSQVRIEVAVIA